MLTDYPQSIVPMRPRHTELTTAPAQEPVTVEDVRLWGSVELESQVTTNLQRDDELVREFILPAARRLVEGYLGESLITQTRTAYFDGVDIGQTNVLDLLYGPLQSVSSIKYTTVDGDLETFAAANYYALTGRRSQVALVQGSTWPSDIRDYDSLQVEYVAGYGASSIATPDYDGTGANGATVNLLATGGTFCGSSSVTYRVTIDDAGDPASFKASNNGNVNYFTSEKTITGEYQHLQMGVYIKFPAVTGQTLDHYWDIACTGNGVPTRYQAAILQLVKYTMTADAGFVNDLLNQTIEQASLPPAIAMLLPYKVKL